MGTQLRSSFLHATRKMGNLCGSDVEKKPEEGTPPNAGTLHYFAGLRSRGEVVRMTAKYGGVEYTMHDLTMEEWGPFKEAEGKKDPKGIQSLPYVTKPDGSDMAETCEVMKYLATLGGKFVVDEANDKLAARANEPPFMLADPFLNLPEATRKAFGIEITKEDALKAIAEGWKTLATELGDKNFFSGEKPGYGEVFVFHNIDNGLTIADKELSEAIGEDAAKKLKAFHKRFSELPGIKEYLAGRPKVCGVPGSVGNPKTD